MLNWMNETKNNIQALKKKDFFNSWTKQEIGLITFFIYPNLNLSNDWIKKRLNIYEENAKKLGVVPPKIIFYIYPSIDAVKDLGITPAITFVKAKEIHGHINQSPGHELTHILLGEISFSGDLPANGLWAEGICVCLDGTNTNRKKQVLSLNYTEDIIKTSWGNWRKNISGDFYPLAGSIIQYCVEVYNWRVLMKFIKGLKNSASNEEKLSIDIFGLSYLKLQKSWEEWIKK